MITRQTRQSDVLSCAAAIEIALPRLAGDHRLRVPLIKVVKVFVAGNPVVKVNQIELLSSLILVVYGEIARCRVHATKPPFWRKLAAIAQASLIAQCINDFGGDSTELTAWLQSVRGQMYFLQCYADLRLEPRWMPNFGLPGQLRNEICGRVWGAAVKVAQGRALEPELNELLLSDEDASHKRQFNPILACLPGPLEGGMVSGATMSVEEAERIKYDLLSERITMASVSGLASAAVIYQFPAELADMAADAIARADYRLAADDDAIFIPHLIGLASAAAITRSSKLADALISLVRTYRHFHPDELTIDAAYQIAMIASGSHSELADWCKCVGDFMIDCAFQPITTEEATHLHSHLVQLCHLIPELWSTCGQAEAALQSIILIP